MAMDSRSATGSTWMTMPEAAHRDAAQGVKVAFALLVPYPAALAAFERDGKALVSVHDVRHYDSTSKSITAAVAAVNPDLIR